MKFLAQIVVQHGMTRQAHRQAQAVVQHGTIVQARVVLGIAVLVRLVQVGLAVQIAQVAGLVQTLALAVLVTGKMKLFGRTGGHWLFWSTAGFVTVGMYNILIEHFVTVELAQAIWIGVVSLPFVIPAFGRWLNMNIDWDKNMFDWFKSKNKMSDNVVPFPEPKEYPKMPYVDPNPEPTTHYTFGLTDDNRLSFTMGYTTLTMNEAGVQQLIDQLEFFKSQLR